MNLSLLEKVAREALKGEDVVSKSNNMFSSGLITPAEHRSLTSLSSQIAANVFSNSTTSTGTVAMVRPMGVWK